MRDWKRQYSTMAAYIGGADSACAYGNLSAAWFRSTTAMGLGVLQAFVAGRRLLGVPRGGDLGQGEKAVSEGEAAGTTRYRREAPGWARLRRSTTTWRPTTAPVCIYACSFLGT